MSVSFILACLWVLAAAIAAALPSKRNHWPAAYALIAIGLPIIAYIYTQHGLWPAAASLLAATSILRWPLLYLIRHLRNR